MMSAVDRFFIEESSFQESVSIYTNPFLIYMYQVISSSAKAEKTIKVNLLRAGVEYLTQLCFRIIKNLSDCMVAKDGTKTTVDKFPILVSFYKITRKE